MSVLVWLLAAGVTFAAALWLPVLFPALFAALLVSAEYLTEAKRA